MKREYIRRKTYIERRNTLNKDINKKGIYIVIMRLYK